jgi:rhodanese-related sulfurtransferase
MKTLSILFSALFFVLVSSSCNAQKEGTIAKDVNVTEFAELIKNGGQLVDVRTPGEYGAGYIENSTLMDFRSADFDKQLEKLDKDKPVYLYCASGGRSGQAMAKMNQMGFKEVYNLKGGFGAWSGQGMNVKK